MFVLRKNELPPVGIVGVGQAIGGITADNCRPICGVSPTKEGGDCLSIVRPYAAGVGRCIGVNSHCASLGFVCSVGIESESVS